MANPQKIALGSDHAGYKTKELIKSVLDEMSIPYEDFGTHTTDSCDYPDYAHAVGSAVAKNDDQLGILVCGSGIGVCIAANKVKGIRAALVFNEEMAELSKQHNDANVLCLGERTTDAKAIPGIVKAWLKTDFEGGRHQRRVDKIEV
ncbi:ribose 5-phosphate isomerase B [bacterium]|nr:ribose 5-phosphate isomerase B [bacterium]QQR58343.1 MAG: ribose 5-phosphate isomerase B [Candidatus Melainabacteria bacterium]